MSVIACLGMLQSVIGAESYLETIVNSLEDTLKFCVRHERILDVNLLFGVTILSGTEIDYISKLLYSVQQQLNDRQLLPTII